jgi:hypothetical protein
MKPKVIQVVLVGGAYMSGRFDPGWAQVEALKDNGDLETLFVPDKAGHGFNAALDFVEDKTDTTEFRARLDEWVRTGVMPRCGSGNEVIIKTQGKE